MVSRNGSHYCLCIYKLTALIAIFFLLSSCIAKNEVQVTLKNPTKAKTATTNLNFTVSNVQVVNHQIIITGTNLNAVSNFNIKEGASTTNLQIESQSNTSIVANTLSNVTFAAGKVFDFIFSNANAASSFTINFSLCDSTLGGKGFNCSITPNDKEVLSYDAVSGKWKPRAVNGLSYQGAWDASTALPSTTTAGDYFIVSVAHGAYSVGDWIVFNGTSFDQINNSATITNVFGRTGAVTANKGDYVLTKMGDVDLTTTPPVANQVLKYNGSNWVPATVTTTESDPTVSAFAKTALPTCGAGQVLKSDGTSLSCVTDNAGSSFTGTANRAVVTDATGALAVSAISDTVLGYLSGTTSNIQTQLNAKVNSSSFVDWSVAGVQTLEPTRLNLTTANRAVVTSAGGVPTASAVTSTELGYLSGSTGNIQAQLNAKLSAETDPSVSAFAKTALPTCLAGEVLKSDGTILSCVTDNTGAGSFNGTQNRVVLTDGATGALTTSTVTNTEIGYVSGVTSAIQTQLNGKQATITSSTALTTGSVQTNLQGAIVVNPFNTAAGNTGEIRFNELAANGANYVALKAPDAIASNVIYTLPAADGSSGQVLTTNAAGGLSWTSVATTGTTLVGDVGGTIGANTIGAGKVTLAHLSATGTKNNTTYLRGDNTWSTLQTDVQALLLSSYTLGTNAVVSTTDSVVSAFGKLQKQISDLTTSAVGGDLTGNLPSPTIAKLQGATVTTSALANKNVLKYNGTNWANSMLSASDLSATGTTDATTYLAGDNTWKNFNTNVIAAPLTGLSATGITKATSTLAATDSISAAFNKLLFTQGDYVSKSVDQTINGSLKINSLTGFIEVPTPVTANEAANKGYVDGFGQWIKGSGGNAADIYFNTGNVGIGTTGPTQKLTVAGGSVSIDNNQRFSAADSGGTYRNLAAITAANVAQYGDTLGVQQLAFFDNGAERMRIDSSGNVGIGITNPSALLDVNGGAYVRATGATSKDGLVVMANGATANQGGLFLTNSSGFVSGTTGNYAYKMSATGTGTSAASSTLKIGLADAATPGTFISNELTLNNGKVGIGTAAPGSKLDIVDGTSEMKMGLNLTSNSGPSLVLASSANVYSDIMFNTVSTDQVRLRGSSYGLAIGGTNPRLNIGYADANYTTAALAVNGNVGIGTTAPTGQLHVHGGVAVGTPLIQSTYVAASNQNGLLIKQANAAGGDLATTSALLRIESTGNNPYMTFDNKFSVLYNGNVGIGTASPNAKLTVSNNVSAGGPAGSYANYQIMLWDSGTANNSYGLGIENNNMWLNTNVGYKFYVVGALAATIGSNGAYTQVSDGRLKTDIQPIEHALDDVLSLRGVTYHWKDPSRGQDRQVGVIAQEVQSVFPELVSITEKGQLSVNYSGLVSPLIEAIKELYAKFMGHDEAIIDLKAKDRAKERAIASVNAKTAKLEAENAAKDQKIYKLEQENAAIKARLENIEKALKSK